MDVVDHDLLRLSRDCSDAYSAPATPKIIPAPLLAGAIVGIMLAIALWVDPVRENPLPCCA